MTLLEKLSKISQTNKIQKRQHKEKNSQSNNRYSEAKKKKENFKEILENEEEILEKTETQQNVKRAKDAYKVQMQISGPIIKKTQKRANALKNIMIPRYEEETKNIQNALDEKEREEFSRLKVIKAQKGKK